MPKPAGEPGNYETTYTIDQHHRAGLQREAISGSAPSPRPTLPSAWPSGNPHPATAAGNTMPLPGSALPHDRRHDHGPPDASVPLFWGMASLYKYIKRWLRK